MEFLVKDFNSIIFAKNGSELKITRMKNIFNTKNNNEAESCKFPDEISNKISSFSIESPELNYYKRKMNKIQKQREKIFIPPFKLNDEFFKDFKNILIFFLK